MPLTFMLAISREEGFGISGSRATRNNNPGNLNLEPWMEAEPFDAVLETIPRGYLEAPRFAAFPSANQGFAAMQQLLTRDYMGLTVQCALNKWAPASDNNDPSAYTANVCEWCNVTPETVLTADLIG